MPIQKLHRQESLSAQESIPLHYVWPDGTALTGEGVYSRTIAFEDMNYRLCQNEDKNVIFSRWCDCLHTFDASVHVQLTFVDLPESEEKLMNRISIPRHGDGLDHVAAEYEDFLRKQYARGNHGLVRDKYLTFSVQGHALREVKSRLDRLELDVHAALRRLGVQAETLTGDAYVSLLSRVLHAGYPGRATLPLRELVGAGLSVRDAVAPSSFTFQAPRHFLMGQTYGEVSFLQILAPELNDQILSEFLEMDCSMVVGMHIEPVDQGKAIRMIKRKITDIQKMIIDEQMKAVRSGYDIDILPSDLSVYGDEAKKLLQDLLNRNEHMFLFTFLIMHLAGNKKQLSSERFQAVGIARKYNCDLVSLDYQQEAGLVSCLPLGYNTTPVERTMTTSGVAIFMPFTTQELFQLEGEPLYCGLNALSHNLILVDRKKLKNPNGLILGTSGSGKSFAAKREIANVVLTTDDDICICDPESEYGALARRLNGQVVVISPTSHDHINPMDLNMYYSDEEHPLSLKADFILSLCELIVGGREGLQPIEKSVIDRCVRAVYEPYLSDPRPEHMPILEDLYTELLRQSEREAQNVAAALEMYVRGSLQVFNHRTNVDTDARLLVYDIRALGQQLKKLGMLIVQDQVWNRVTRNRSQKRSTRYYIDELHLLLKEEQTAAYTVEIWKRFRKWGGIPTGITQNVKDLLRSREVENILDNSDYICMLNQAHGDRQILARTLNISPGQMAYVTQANEGAGLLFYGTTILPFVDRFPADTELYQIMTTRLDEQTSAQREETEPCQIS